MGSLAWGAPSWDNAAKDVRISAKEAYFVRHRLAFERHLQPA